MSAPDVVLLLTHSEDEFTVDRVAEALRARGARPLRVDTDRFPTELSLAMSVTPDGCSHELDLAGETRRVWPPRLDEDLDPSFREGCAREASTTLNAFLSGLSGARWVDPTARVDAAEDKPWQLREARAAGLPIPRTLITNDPARVRAFRAALGAPMVTQMLSALSHGMEGRGFFVHTSLVSDGDLDDLDALRLCPMVFQELVPKRVELRVICVGGRFFTGAVDLIVRPDGEYVFPEANPAGEWGMIERDLGLPIGAALADVLLWRPCNAG